MNARLLVKSLRRPERPNPTAPPANDGQGPDAGQLRLLGEGTDAILVRMRPDVCVPSPEARLLRYIRASHIHRSAADSRMDQVRLELGTALQAAWAAGRRPDLRFGRPMLLQPAGVR